LALRSRDQTRSDEQPSKTLPHSSSLGKLPSLFLSPQPPSQFNFFSFPCLPFAAFLALHRGFRAIFSSYFSYSLEPTSPWLPSPPSGTMTPISRFSRRLWLSLRRLPLRGTRFSRRWPKKATFTQPALPCNYLLPSSSLSLLFLVPPTNRPSPTFNSSPHHTRSPFLPTLFSAQLVFGSSIRHHGTSFRAHDMGCDRRPRSPGCDDRGISTFAGPNSPGPGKNGHIWLHLHCQGNLVLLTLNSFISASHFTFHACLGT